uniref:Uncharacterized conserved protein YegL, contains vWA domain of TerY type n=1 Tax=Candidatus Kentrum sp. FM TaxID=2126340 RepID=A0A450SGQ4_9GAMM|nr:MAG: Uncharacterized conserved protein YegL, contains vWA domain of TerY type [Candidatus Kentron sp. FM]VFJ52270.1 MAG: Uncharacterized conserved protein YegL, contains vWA domain of TerY type [Candidatus Kentron sp. FM]VFK09260.1 MAG: Uncharacterized conserved protein YegL, contains vWA domain of TerY type [Candidatus Kentron sp. FM]
MRRLPVYLLLDTSSSMMGEPIESVKTGVKSLLTALRQDPYALETAYLSVITFDNKARQVVPLTELISFQAPDIKANGTTAMGDALRLLTDKIGEEVQKGSAEHKGDWKPLVFLMTDGGPNDEWKSAVDAFKQVPAGIVVACGAGDHADTDVLKRITENVVKIDSNDAAAFAAFFKWVSSSISTTSKRVDLTKSDVGNKLDELPPPPPEVNVVV